MSDTESTTSSMGYASDNAQLHMQLRLLQSQKCGADKEIASLRAALARGALMQAHAAELQQQQVHQARREVEDLEVQLRAAQVEIAALHRNHHQVPKASPRTTASVNQLEEEVLEWQMNTERLEAENTQLKEELARMGQCLSATRQAESEQRQMIILLQLELKRALTAVGYVEEKPNNIY